VWAEEGGSCGQEGRLAREEGGSGAEEGRVVREEGEAGKIGKRRAEAVGRARWEGGRLVGEEGGSCGQDGRLARGKGGSGGGGKVGERVGRKRGQVIEEDVGMKGRTLSRFRGDHSRCLARVLFCVGAASRST
jgi:hypothetical protein